MNRSERRRQSKATDKLAAAKQSASLDPLIQLLRQGLSLQKQSRLEEAANCYRRVLAAAPGNAPANHLLGLVAHQSGRNSEALALIERAVAAAPSNPDYLCDLGVVLAALERPADAAQRLQNALKIRPGDVRTLANLGTTYVQAGRHREAAEALRAALELAPDSAALHNNLGNVLIILEGGEAAIACYRRALAIDPNYVDALSNLGYALAGIGQVDEAIRHYDAALRIKPDYIGAHFNLGLALTKKGHLADAVATFRTALKLNPLFVEALRGLGDVLIKLGQTQQGIAAYELALEHKPDYAAALGSLLFFKNYLADSDPGQMLAEARRYGRMVTNEVKQVRRHANTPDPDRRLRVGLVSGDLCTHVVSRFLESVLHEIDPAQIELFAYATTDHVDEMTARLKQSVPNWREVTYYGDSKLIDTITADRIDILVDLSGHSASHRLPVFASKPAPIAVTWLGYFATTGVEAIDYVLSNQWVIPVEEEDQWVETPWRLPDTYLCFSTPRQDVAVRGLPAATSGSITFGSFNNLNKLSDRTVACWANVINTIPSSRLLLRTEALADAETARMTRQRFAAHGVPPDRLELEGHLSNYTAHLRTYGRVDIALDPFPYAGGTTTVEALWMGVPVLTLKGDRYVSHMGESIMHNMAMPEWIADTTEDYVAKAAAFAADLPRLAAIRAGLRERFIASPLGDAPRFARNLEAAFRGMWKIWCAEQVQKST